MTFKDSFVETEPTAPGGGSMRWTVEVEEPDIVIRSITAMVHVTEDTTADPEKDCLLLGLDDAERLIEALHRAIAFGRKAERIARDLDDHHRGTDGERAGAYDRRMREEP